MPLDPHIFRAYDIRGKAGSQITEEACFSIGFHFGQMVSEKYGKPSPNIVVGRDARTHSPAYEEALIKGLTEAGCTVLAIGETPSPVNYFATCTREADGSVQVTASHNPGSDNGLKLQVRNSASFAGEDLQKLRERIEAHTTNNPPHTQQHPSAGADLKGTIEAIDAINPYITFMTKMFPGIRSGMKIVTDMGNGVGGPIYNEIFRKIGCKVIELYSDPDGTFPNHPADPSKWETLKELQERVVSENADLGFAFDGDGDRLGVVDETGTIRTADDILLILARDHLTRHGGTTIVCTVSNSSLLQTEVEKWGGKCVMCTVGHSHVEHVMEEHGSLLGGEQSGHFFCFENYFPCDDALLAALRTLDIYSRHSGSFSTLFADIPVVVQAPENRPNCSDEHKTRIVKSITEHFLKTHEVNTLDGARIDFGDGAWAGIRQSNTSPKLSICMEARTEEKLKEVEEVVLGHMRGYSEIEWGA